MAGEVVGSARIVIEPDMAGFERSLSSDVQRAAERAADSMERAFVSGARTSADAVDGISAALTGIPDIDIPVNVDDEQLDQLSRDLLPLTGEEKQVVIGAQIAEAQRQIRALDRQIGEATEPEEVRILVDQRGAAVRKLNTLEGEVRDVGDELEKADDAAGALGGALKGLGALAAGKALFDIAAGASELEQAVGGTETLFGDAAGTISDFADTSATAFGLTAREARTLTSQIGGLLQGFDFTQAEAASTSVEISKLGADLSAAFGGSVTEAVDALGGALRGEFNALERFGVSLNVAQIEAYALEEGLVASKSEMTLATRATAALALIQERTNTVQGQFTRELETAGGVMATTRAVVAGLADEAGENLLPGLIVMAEALRDDVGPALFKLAEAGFPIVSEALIAFAPLMGTTTDLLLAAAPAIQLVADTIELIPTPVLSAAGAFLAFNRAAKALQGLNLAKTLRGAAGGSKLLAGAGGLIKAHPYITAAAGVAALGTALIRADGDMEDFLGGVGDSVKGMLGMQTTAEKTAEIMAKLGDGLDLSTLEGLREGEERLASFKDAFSEDAIGIDIDVPGLDEFNEKLSQSAIDALAAADAAGTLSDEFAVQRAQLSLTNASSSEWIALLEEATPSIQRNAQELAAVADKYADLAAVGNLTADSVGALLYESGTASVALLNLKADAGGAEEQLLNLAVAAGQGAVSEEEMADLATVLGVELESLEGFVGNVNEAINTFADSALKGIPAVADAFKDANEDGKVSAREFVDTLNTNAESIRTFQQDLATIQEAGFVGLSAIIAERGPEFGASLADELATAAETGNTALLEEVELGVMNAEDAYSDMEQYLRTELGPKFILTSGLLGSAATSAFGANLDFGDRIKLSGQIAALNLTTEGKAIAAIAAVEGADAARAYGTAMDIDDRVVEEGIEAGLALQNVPTSGASTGGDRMASSFVGGMAGGIYNRIAAVEAAARSMVSRSIGSALGEMAARSPSRVMMEAGENFALGMAIGIGNEESAVVSAAENIVREAAESSSAMSLGVPITSADAVGGSTPFNRRRGAVGGPGSESISVTVNVNGPVDSNSAREIGDTIGERVSQVLANRSAQTDIRLAGSRTSR